MKARLLGRLLGRPDTDTSGNKRAAPRKPTRLSRFQSVSIVHGGKCCPPVKSLTGQRFLASNAPSLPLPTCSLPGQCKCSFQKHDDRRDEDRRLPGEKSKWYGGAEKRRSRDRRRTD